MYKSSALWSDLFTWDQKDNLYTSSMQAVGVDTSCSAYSTKLKPTCGINLGTKQEDETRIARVRGVDRGWRKTVEKGTR